MIEVKNLEVFYGKNKILNNINFSINSGEIICVLGENGSGKSTLLKSILRLIDIKNGDVFINDKSIKQYDNRELSKIISYIPQSHSPSFDYKVIDVIYMGNYAKKNGMFFRITKEDEQRVEKILNMLNISYLANKSYRKISGGERQLVLIARALVQANKYIFMDEPVANLDFGNQLKIMEICNYLKNKGIGFLITTHNPNHALTYADKILIIKNNGESIFGDVKTLLDKDILEKLYNIPVEIIKTDDGNNYCIPDYRKVRENYVLD